MLNSDSEICRLSSKVTICKDSVFCISEKGRLVYHGTYQECTDFLDRLENNTARGTRMPRLFQSKLLKLFRRLIGLGSWRRQEMSGEGKRCQEPNLRNSLESAIHVNGS